jgi:hypothetical protein
MPPPLSTFSETDVGAAPFGAAVLKVFEAYLVVSGCVGNSFYFSPLPDLASNSAINLEEWYLSGATDGSSILLFIALLCNCSLE